MTVILVVRLRRKSLSEVMSEKLETVEASSLTTSTHLIPYILKRSLGGSVRAVRDR